MADDATLNILIKAKNQASGDIKAVKGDVTDVAKESEQASALLTKTGIAIAAVGVGITAYAKSATDYTVSLVASTKQVSRETGVASDEASRLVYITNRLGIDSSQSSVIFGNFSKQITAAGQAADPTTTALGKLGVKVQDANSNLRPFNDILLDTADKFKGMPDGPEKTAAALEIFGRSGKDMIKVLNLGSAGIKDLEKRADDLGLTLNSKTIASVSKYVQSTKDMQDSSNALKVTVGSLTVPVLTRFNENVNTITMSIIKNSGPFKSLIANTLAFGGPVMTAAGTMIAFAANARTAGITMGVLSAAARTLWTALTGPVGLAITGVTVLLGVFGFALDKNRQKTQEATSSTANMTTAEEDLNTTMSDLARNTDRVTQATNVLKDAQFDAEGSSLSVEAAQRSYNEAVKEYGPKSLEARQAAHQLEQAKQDLAAANDKVKVAQDAANLAEGTLIAVTPAVASAIQVRADKLAVVRDLVLGTIGKVVELDMKLGNVQSSGLNVANNLQGAFGNVQGAINTVQNTFGNVQNAANNIQRTVTDIAQKSSSAGISLGAATRGSNIPLRAAGGPVSAGQPYWVGDNSDGTLNKTSELFVPNVSGTIVPQSKMGGGSNINITNHNTFVRETDPLAFARQQAFELARR